MSRLQTLAYFRQLLFLTLASILVSSCMGPDRPEIASSSFSQIVSQLNDASRHNSPNRGCSDEASAAAIEAEAERNIRNKTGNQINAHLDLSAVHKFRGNEARACAEMNEVVNLRPKDPYYLCLRAQLYSSLGNLKEAVNDYTRALEMGPAAGPLKSAYLQSRAEIYWKMKDYKAAVNDLTECLKIGSDKLLRQRRADYYLLWGDYEHCIQDCKLILKKSDFAKGAFLTLCTAYLLKGNPESALQAAKERKLDDYARHYCMADALFRLGKFNDCVQEATKTMEMMHSGKVGASKYDNSELVYSLKHMLTLRADAYEKLGKAKEATADRAAAAPLESFDILAAQ